jgi:hypothetical protein
LSVGRFVGRAEDTILGLINSRDAKTNQGLLHGQPGRFER